MPPARLEPGGILWRDLGPQIDALPERRARLVVAIGGARVQRLRCLHAAGLESRDLVAEPQDHRPQPRQLGLDRHPLVLEFRIADSSHCRRPPHERVDLDRRRRPLRGVLQGFVEAVAAQQHRGSEMLARAFQPCGCRSLGGILGRPHSFVLGIQPGRRVVDVPLRLRPSGVGGVARLQHLVEVREMLLPPAKLGRRLAGEEVRIVIDRPDRDARDRRVAGDHASGVDDLLSSRRQL
jgi:hypothetical protein